MRLRREEYAHASGKQSQKVLWDSASVIAAFIPDVNSYLRGINVDSLTDIFFVKYTRFIRPFLDCSSPRLLRHLESQC